MYCIHDFMKIHDLDSHAFVSQSAGMNHSATSQAQPFFVRWVRALGLARGTFKSAGLSERPERALELYSYEGCPMCRRVRQTLTELDLDYVHRSCPRGDSHNRRELVRRGGKMQVPYLVDPNSGVEMYESSRIVRHLLSSYGPNDTAELRA